MPDCAAWKSITAIFFDLDGTRADKGDLLAHVLDQGQIRPTDAVMIGDREHDIKGALANGVDPIGALWSYGSREELTHTGAMALCKTPNLLTKGEIIRHDPPLKAFQVLQRS